MIVGGGVLRGRGLGVRPPVVAVASAVAVVVVSVAAVVIVMAVIVVAVPAAVVALVLAVLHGDLLDHDPGLLDGDGLAVLPGHLPALLQGDRHRALDRHVLAVGLGHVETFLYHRSEIVKINQLKYFVSYV